MPTYTDREIVVSIKKGGRTLNTVMSYIYNEPLYRGKVFNLVRGKGGSTQDAEDVFQDGIRALIIAIRQDKYRGEGSINAFLFQTCRNLWLKKFNKQLREKDYKESQSVSAIDFKNPENLLLDEERKQNVKTVMGNMGEKCRSVLEMWTLSYSMKEIASELGYSDARVARKKKHQCLQKLIAIMDKHPVYNDLIK